MATHAQGNMRVLNQMAAELLNAAAEQNLPRIDKTLYFKLFAPNQTRQKRNQ